MFTLMNILGQPTNRGRYDVPTPNIEYTRYINDTFGLVTSMVIKSSAIIEESNQAIKLKYGNDIVDERYPETWRWYCHVSGNYHQLDNPIRLTSVDTFKEFTLTKESIREHPKTREALTYGGELYNLVKAIYPDEIMLVRGILNPVDLDYAIAASDWMILSYDARYVEANEITLIEELQRWLLNFIQRYHLEAYQLIEKFYIMVHYALTHTTLVPKILNMRLERIKTTEVHSFHVKQYLASHQYLDRYYRFMSHKQRMFLYRNMDYIQRHYGHAHLLSELVQTLLVETNIKVYQNYIKHIYSGSEAVNNYHIDKRPFFKSNLHHNATSLSVEECLLKQNALAQRNPLQNLRVIDQDVQSSIGHLRDVKCYQVDIREREGYTNLTELQIFLNNFYYLAYHQKITASVSFVNVVANTTRILRADEAAYLILYLNMRALGITLEYLPDLKIDRIRTAVDYGGDLPRYIDKLYIDTIVKSSALKDSYTNYSSIVDDTKTIYREINTIEVMVRNLPTPLHHHHLNYLYRTLYPSYLLRPKQPQTYNAWLDERGFDFTDYTVSQITKLLEGLFLELTSGDITVMREYRNKVAMVDLIEELTSYTIHILRDETLDIKHYVLPKLRNLIAGSNASTTEVRNLHGVVNLEGYTEKTYETEKRMPSLTVGDTYSMTHVGISKGGYEFTPKRQEHRVVRSGTIMNYSLVADGVLGIPEGAIVTDVYNTKAYRSTIGKNNLVKLIEVNKLKVFKHLKTQ